MEENNIPPPVDPVTSQGSSALPPSPLPQKADHTYAMLCHLLSLAGYVGIPFGNILGPLIFWLIKKDQYPEVDLHGKESLNFQISMTIYAIGAGLLVFLVVGIILLPIIVIAGLVYTILATVKASKGEFYRYPFTIRLIS